MADTSIQSFIPEFVAVNYTQSASVNQSQKADDENFKNYLDKCSDSKNTRQNTYDKDYRKKDVQSGEYEKTETKVESKNNTKSEDVKESTDMEDVTKENMETTSKESENTDINFEDESTEVMSSVVAQALQVFKAMDEFKSQIADALGMSKEELEKTLSRMSMSETELFSKEGMKKLILEVNGLEKPQDLLLNGEAMQDFKEVTEIVEKVLQSLEEQGIDTEKLMSEEMSLPDVNVTENTVLTNNTFSETKQDVQDTTEETVESEEVYVEEAVNETENTATTKNQSDTSKNSHRDSKSGDERTAITVNQEGNTVSFNPIENIEVNLTERIGRIQAENIIEQIRDQIKLNVNSKFTSMDMQLYPEHLGKVGVQVAVKDGVLTAQITAENEAVKRVIETQLASLKENFVNQGLKVENVEVTIASHSFEQNDMNRQSGDGQNGQNRRNRRVSASLLDEINGNVEKTEESVMETMGNTVSYIA